MRSERSENYTELDFILGIFELESSELELKLGLMANTTKCCAGGTSPAVTPG